MLLRFLGFSQTRRHYAGPVVTSIEAGEAADVPQEEAERLLSDFPGVWVQVEAEPEPEPAPADLDSLDLDALRALYAAEGGTDDVSRAKTTTVIKKIRELRGTPDEG